MKKTFILLYISLILLSCQKEENNKIYEYQVLPVKMRLNHSAVLGRNVLLLLQLFRKH